MAGSCTALLIRLSSFRHDAYVVLRRLVEAFVAALTALGRINPADFRQAAERLEGLPYTTPQRLLARAYRALPELYAEDALDFLVSDQRRLDLGDREQSCREFN